jgi:hypothetical protein
MIAWAIILLIHYLSVNKTNNSRVEKE